MRKLLIFAILITGFAFCNEDFKFESDILKLLEKTSRCVDFDKSSTIRDDPKLIEHLRSFLEVFDAHRTNPSIVSYLCSSEDSTITHTILLQETDMTLMLIEVYYKDNALTRYIFAGREDNGLSAYRIKDENRIELDSKTYFVGYKDIKTWIFDLYKRFKVMAALPR
jgi:hypothetical protein